MKLKTTLVVGTEAEHNYFDYFRLKMVDEGVQLQAKSPLFGAWMQSFCDAEPTYLALRTTHPWYDGPKAYKKFVREWPPAMGGGESIGWIYPEQVHFFEEGRPNLLWLAHKDLATGINLVVKQPISLNNFQDYFSECCESIRDIYVGLLRKANAEATFSEVWPEV